MLTLSTQPLFLLQAIKDFLKKLRLKSTSWEIEAMTDILKSKLIN